MSELIQNMQMKIKTGSKDIFTFLVRMISGLVLGLTLTLIFEQAFGYGLFLFWFVIITITGIFLKISQAWSLSMLLIFDLICVLIGLLLRMYILIAPG